MSQVWCGCMCHHLCEYAGDECWCDCNKRSYEMTEREKYVEQLRELADFYAGASDDLPRPPINTTVYVQKEDISFIIGACRKLKKTASGGYLSLLKSLDFNVLNFRIAQEEVCERKVVGRKWVPEYKQDAHFQDQVEWECKPILEGIEESQ